MSDYNHVGISGRLTRDMELKFTKGGQAVGEFGLASNRKYGDKEETVFVDVTVWGKTAEALAQYLVKGKHVVVGGRLKLDTWETDGQKRSKLVMVADTLDFTPGGPQTSEPSAKTNKTNDFVPAVGYDEEDVPF